MKFPSVNGLWSFSRGHWGDIPMDLQLSCVLLVTDVVCAQYIDANGGLKGKDRLLP